MRLITSIVTIGALAIAAPAVADRGGNGGGNSGSQGGSPPAPKSYEPSLSLSWPLAAPTSTSDSTQYVIEGCGYDPSYGLVTVVDYTPISAGWTGRMPDASGCISVPNWSTLGPGTCRFEAWQHVKNKDVVVATTGFTL
jgi:hypothetical protein